MGKKRILLSILTAASIFIGGCGGGDSSDIVSGSDTQTGVFIDSPVDGLEYSTTSGIEGVTQDGGKFKFNNGDKVEFRLGKILLGTTTPSNDGVVTPYELAKDEDTAVLILQLLQSLDEDGDLSNGITIPQEIVEKLNEKLNETKDIEDLNESVIENELEIEIDVNKSEAKEHFYKSINKWKYQHDKGDNSQEKDKNQGGGNGNNGGSGPVVDVGQYDTYMLTQELKDAIAYMGNEERLAYDVYSNLYQFYDGDNSDIKQLSNIAQKSEIRHIATVRALVEKYGLTQNDLTILDKEVVGGPDTDVDSVKGKYDIDKIQKLYDALYAKGIESKQAALEVGCMVEVTDVNDLDEYIKEAEEINAKDVIDAFKALRSGSYNHYWAFDKGLKNMGVDEGCCSLGEEFCHPEYPQNEHNHDGNQSTPGNPPQDKGDGNHNGQGNGKGKGTGAQN
ncbi:MAG: DUF2202 domain-containing protein [Epsilonproteobacteria bacterium]|nr:DUF2202 domain-containing protein [Campylobacterota bacterium]